MKRISYTSGTSTTPLLGITIGDKFDEIVEKFSEREALIVHHQQIRWTYSRLQQEVNECAKALLACGLNKGDRVGIWSPNRYEWTVIQFATAKLGIILGQYQSSLQGTRTGICPESVGLQYVGLCQQV